MKKKAFKVIHFFFAIWLAILIRSADAEIKAPDVRKFYLTYQVELKEVPVSVEQLRVWTPLPCSDEDQIILDVSVQSPYPFTVNYDSEWGNAIIYFTVSAPKPFKYQITCLVERHERRVLGLDYQKAICLDGLDGLFHRYLKPSAFAVINDSVKKFAADAANGRNNALDKARGAYEFVYSHLNYDKSIPGWGKGDVNRLCFVLNEGKTGRGNCTDFHSLFSSLLQVMGIPVKFELGYALNEGRDQLAPVTGGYHCWAKFFMPDYGWIPVDISEAYKAPNKKNYFWGGIDAERIRFSTGRDILLSPPQEGTRLNFFGPDPYMEADGKEFNSFARSIAYRHIK